jgi:hypothetical protein
VNPIEQAALGHAERGPAHNLARFITEARAQLPYQDVVWEEAVWSIAGNDVTKRAHLTNNKTLYFTQHAGPRVPLEQRVVFESAYADLVKACIVRRRVNRGMGSGPQRVFLRAARYLYDALPLPVRRDPTRITRGHFVAAETASLRREQASSAYRAAQFLEQFARLLDRHNLCRSNIEFRSSVPRPKNIADRTSAAFEERVQGLPTRDVLDALAVISNDPSLEERPFDVLRIRIAEVLVVAGFRAGEMLTLPENPVVKDFVRDEAGEIRLDAITGAPIEAIGIRYWPEKGGEPVVRWVPTVANPLVLRALDDINRLCEPSRKNAKWLEEHPGDVDLEVEDTKLISLQEAAETIGVANARQVRQWFGQRGRGGGNVVMKVGGRAIVTGAALRRALASDRYDKPVLTRADGRRQTLGASLLTMFLYQWSENRPPNRFISMPVTWQHLNDFLCGRDNVPSVFARQGYVDDAGQPLRIKTHDFRRLLNIIAQRGGLSQIEIAQWMGRRRVADNVAYDLRTAAEIATEMRTLVSKNEVYGTIATQVQALPESDRSAFIDARLAMVHTTPLGDCASNIAENPCATAVSCLGGCRHYLRRKGDKKSRQSLERIEREALIALQRAREAMNEGKFNAENWVRSQETVLRTAREALAIDDDEDLEVGELRHVNAGGPMIGKPL